MRIIDSHVHVARRDQWSEASVKLWFEPFGLTADVFDIDTDAFVADMRKSGVDLAVFLAFAARRNLQVHVTNEYVAAECARHSAHAIGFASVDPLERNAVEQLRYAIETLGLVGLKLAPTYQDFHPDDRQARPVFEYCANRGIPVLIHMGFSVHRHARLALQPVALMDEICTTFPDLRVIVAHVGMPARTDTLHLMVKHRNVYADLSARDAPGYGGGARTMWEDVSDAMVMKIDHKLFWGTDFPWSTTANSLAALRGIEKITQFGRPTPNRDQLAMILGGNFEHLAQDLGWSLPSASG